MQRLIVAQISGTDDGYSGNVRYPEDAPWVNWGPYLWASGETPSSSGIFWCDGQSDQICQGKFDFRYGDVLHDPITYWGDHTHPTANAEEKVARQLVRFIGKDPDPNKPGSPFVTPWIGE